MLVFWIPENFINKIKEIPSTYKFNKCHYRYTVVHGNTDNMRKNNSLWWDQYDGIVQERRNASANALKIRLSCTNPSNTFDDKTNNITDMRVGTTKITWKCMNGTKIQGVNSLWPSDTIWRHRSGSTLAQVRACCLTAPSHYLNQCWLIISEVQWQSHEGNITRDTSAMNYQILNLACKFLIIWNFSQIPQGPMS